MTTDVTQYPSSPREDSFGIQIRLLEADETIASTHPGEVAFYEAAFQAGLRLPIHPTIKRILVYYKVSPTQLAPNAWHVFGIFNNPKPKFWMTLLQGKVEENPAWGYPINVKGRKKDFFFISGDNWEFAHGQSRELGVPMVPRS
ncbi:hypothetical protein Acr_22g0006850 [Actinidia rufa]|uniref:Transposase (putative) gypsy type domain-containing protein n=1 Tax=Actinidia rufa TaxID=165716 RepID=A0A7J0GKE4_9ERIC|nr:hypothetical protein Acr_22g0006850 [Actinidia rufa]